MPHTITFTIPATPACPPLTGGTGDKAFVKAKTEATAKVKDGSGYFLGEITSASKTSPTSWEYAITIPDEEVTTGEAIAPADVEQHVSCLSGSDAALLAKIKLLQ